MPSHPPVPHGRVVILLLIAVIVALGAGLGVSGILLHPPAQAAAGAPAGQQADVRIPERWSTECCAAPGPRRPGSRPET